MKLGIFALCYFQINKSTTTNSMLQRDLVILHFFGNICLPKLFFYHFRFLSHAFIISFTLGIRDYKMHALKIIKFLKRKSKLTSNLYLNIIIVDLRGKIQLHNIISSLKDLFALCFEIVFTSPWPRHLAALINGTLCIVLVYVAASNNQNNVWNSRVQEACWLWIRFT